MALLITLLGITLALVAALAGRPVAAIAAGYVFFVGVVFVALGWGMGANAPRAASAAFRLGLLLPLSLGAIAGALGIWLAAIVTQAQGPQPTPWASAVGGAAAGLVTALVAKLQGLDSLMPPSLARRLITHRYARAFPHLDGTPSQAFATAYRAIWQDPMQVPGAPPIKGWGYDATARRLELIRLGLSPAPPPVPPGP